MRHTLFCASSVHGGKVVLDFEPTSKSVKMERYQYDAKVILGLLQYWLPSATYDEIIRMANAQAADTSRIPNTTPMAVRDLAGNPLDERRVR